MSFFDLLVFAAEMVGIVAFAASGAMTALKHNMDLMGVPFLAAITALGGGLLRDLLIGRLPPIMFQDYRYVLTAVITAFVLFVVARIAGNRYDRLEEKLAVWANVFDAIGLGPFVCVGIEAGIAAGYGSNGFFLVFLSLVTCIGGGILRDLFVVQIPGVLQKHIYALPCLLGACLYLGLIRGQVSKLIATLAVFVFVFTFRMLATHFRWNLPRGLRS